MNSKTAMRASAWDLNRRRFRSSHSSGILHRFGNALRYQDLVILHSEYN